jgi:hypothetical protein
VENNMKDEADIYTKEMFGKQVSKPITDPDARQFANLPQKEAKDKAKEAPKKSGSVGSSSISLEKGMMGGRFKPTLHAKGGKVAGKLAKRGYGICKK